jgi:uncharacterized cupin superfamily protein
MASYEVVDVGAIEKWGEHYGGFSPQTSLHGRRLLDREIPLTFSGITVNSRVPGEGADYRHAHSVLEELYLFLAGEGVMLLGDQVFPVHEGTAIRVGQGVMRSWYCLPESRVPLAWLCIRAGAGPLEAVPSDATPLRDVPLPWAEGQPPLAVEPADAPLPEGCQRFEAGPLDAWGDAYGGHSEATSAPGRRVLDKEIPLEFIGVTVNSREPGEGAHYWHSHAVIEELYLFLEGEGVMALDDELLPVHAGSAVRVTQGVRRSWRASPDSPGPMRWVCIRAGGAPLTELRDATLYPEIPLPWA